MNKQVRILMCVTIVAIALLPTLTASAALPTNLAWVKSMSNPVANSTLCYSGEHFDPAIVVESTSNYKMYFSHRSNGADIYLATSSDGGQTWTCANSSLPVLTRGGASAWDATRVMSASVIKEGPSSYKMWYVGRDASAQYAVGYAYSTDGISWTKNGGTGGPVLTVGSPLAWDSEYVREPSVLNVGGTYHMWYSGTARWPYFHIGHATSTDGGITWTKDGSNPIITRTAVSWDENEQYAPSVIQNGGNFEMFYSGSSGGRWVTGHATATSANGPWTKDANAIISPNAIGWETGFDSTDYVAGVLDGSTWKVFYSAGGGYQIGLATLTNQAQLTFNPLASSVAVGNDIVIKIDLNAVTNLYGYQFQVTYDATKVSATGAFVNDFFDTTGQFKPGGWDASCAVGTCKFAVTRQGAASGVDGSGTIAQITFTGIAAGDVPLTFSSDILTDKDANQITHSVTTSFLTVLKSVVVSGKVNMQGRTYPTGTPGSVTIYDEYGYAPSVTTSFSAVDGTWTATVAVSPGSTMFDIEASHGLYLTNRATGINLSGAGPFVQATTRLLGGDANNDGKIDINDMSCIGGAFGGAPTVCGATGSSDINADTTVNILDLVLAGGNFDRVAPQPW